MITRREFLKYSILPSSLVLAGNGLSLASTSDILIPRNKQIPFKYYDELFYVGKPDLKPYGLSPVHVAYTWQLWGEGKFDNTYDTPPIEALLSYPERYNLSKNPPELFILNIEHWKHYGNLSAKKLDSNIKKYLLCINTLRSVLPKQTRLSIYNIGPQPNFGHLKSRELNSNEKKRWMQSNDLVQPIVDAMDVITPSCYFGTDYSYEIWERKARYYFAEAKRLGHHKPVIPFIWPQFSNLLPLIELPGPLWAKILDYVYQETDSVVLWRRHKGPKASQWKPDAGWWNETIKHINKRNPV